jgi:hypothetical protein
MTAWGATVQTPWIASEAWCVAHSCPGGGLHLNDDLTIIEPVDEHGREVPRERDRRRSW